MELREVETEIENIKKRNRRYTQMEKQKIIKCF